MPLTEDFQFIFNGLVFGSGTDYDLVSVRGLDDLPDVRTSDTPRPADHGLYPGRDFASGRVIEIDLEVSGATDAAFRANIEVLAAATVLTQTEQPLQFRLPSASSGDRRINCRPRRRHIPVVRNYQYRILPVVLQFLASDPRVYDDDLSSLSTAAATSGGGRTYDRVYPLTYAAGGTGGTILATNGGNFPTRPVVTFTGPSTTPRLENVTTGQHLAFDLTLAAGETLVVDLDARTVLLNGTASRYSTLISGSSWWELAPGDNSLKFTSADSQGTVLVAFRSAYL